MNEALKYAEYDGTRFVIVLERVGYNTIKSAQGWTLGIYFTI